MSVDAGMAQILSQYNGSDGNGTGAQVHAEMTLEAQIGRLLNLFERREQRDAGQAQRDAQAIAPIDIGPLDFIVTGGQPKFKAHRATGADMSAQEAYVWFVQRLSLAGMNAGDLVNIYRGDAAGIAVNANGLHTFTGPAGVAAGLGIADWEPGSMGLIMRPDDTFTLQSAGTLAATEIILTGQAIQVAVPYLFDFLS